MEIETNKSELLVRKKTYSIQSRFVNGIFVEGLISLKDKEIFRTQDINSWSKYLQKITK